MLVYIYLPGNDGEFEFEARMSYTPGREAKIDGPPEYCYPAEPAECEFADYGPFDNMEEAVWAAAWATGCSISLEDIEKIAAKVEADHVDQYLGEAEEDDNDYDI